jgi:ketosteroid isomerase-like protein
MAADERSEDEIQLMREIYSHLQDWNAEALGSLVAHDIEWHIPESLPWGGIHHGPDGFEVIAELVQEHVEGPWADPDDFLDAGDRIVVLGRVRGRARATGIEYESPFVHIWGMSDGVPSSLRAYFDTATINAAIEGADA